MLLKKRFKLKEINFRKILKALEDIDYNGYISVECLP